MLPFHCSPPGHANAHSKCGPAKLTSDIARWSKMQYRAGDDSNTLVTTHNCPPDRTFCKIKYVTENAFDMNIMVKNAQVHVSNTLVTSPGVKGRLGTWVHSVI